MTLHYEYPVDITLDEVKAIVAKNPNFYLGERDGYIVANYLVAGKDTHPPVLDRETAIMREMRGLIFSPDGKILSRRLHKFFNLGEREDVAQIDISKHHTVLEKLDGSMITPVMINGAIRWCTKMGVTEVAGPVEEFVDAHQDYVDFARVCLNANMTPIFEWCSRKQRIVIDYPEDRLVLIAVRHNFTGVYVKPEWLSFLVYPEFDIPIVNAMEPIKDMDRFVEELRKREDIEGVVIRFDDGHMVKIKTDTYISLHKAKSELENERNVVRLVLEDKIDDLIPLLSEADRDRLLEFSFQVTKEMIGFTFKLADIFEHIRENRVTRKDFALAKIWSPIYRPFIFDAWDTQEYTFEMLRDHILKYLGSNKSFERVTPIIKTRWKEVKVND